MARPQWLDSDRYEFPDPRLALTEPNGLLAIGGDLAPGRLLAAYRAGIFPWFDSDGGPPLWWSPDPRAVLLPKDLRISRSLGKRLRRNDFRVTFDCAFLDVVTECAAPRRGDAGANRGTWITKAMAAAYTELHRLGYAHSVEVWRENSLIGGLYGVSLGRLFFGESMFTRATDASKIALVHLARLLTSWDFPLIDCQMMNPHLESLGAVTISRSTFLAILAHNLRYPDHRGSWRDAAALGRHT